jgi:hypothetical protein
MAGTTPLQIAALSRRNRLDAVGPWEVLSRLPEVETPKKSDRWSPRAMSYYSVPLMTLSKLRRLTSSSYLAGRHEHKPTNELRTIRRHIRSGCCAHATTGHAAAPPSPAMNSRRRIRDLPR